MPIKFGDAKTLKKGQIVIVAGQSVRHCPRRPGQRQLGHRLESGPQGRPALQRRRSRRCISYGTLIQTDAKLNLGTSGGALVNLKGEMVGLTTSLAATSGYEQAAGYAIPSTTRSCGSSKR